MSAAAALATERLSLDSRGRIFDELRPPDSDGRTHVVLTPREFQARLCAQFPYSRTHLLWEHGVLALASTLRDEAAPSPTGGERAQERSSVAFARIR